MQAGIELGRKAVISCGLILGFAAAVFSQARVALYSGEEILKDAQDSDRYVIKRIDYAKRGAIYSSDGRVLAESQDTYRLRINPKETPRTAGFFLALGHAAGVPSSELGHMILAGKSCVWPDPLSESAAQAVGIVKSSWKAHGVSLERVSQRSYPLGAATTSVVGIVRDGVARSGLELSKNALLAGKHGSQEGMVDKTGSFLPMRMQGSPSKRVNGSSIQLTIDSALQLEAQEAVRRSVESNRANQGMAIIYDPKTGRLLAMASWPAMDPTGQSWITGEGTTFEPCTMAVFEPGSTFKILTLAKALDAKVVTPGRTVQCSGEMSLGNNLRVRCDLHNGARSHGNVDLEKAIAKSCNVSAAGWALRIGYQPMVRYLEDLGLLEQLQLGLPLERGGLFDRTDSAKKLQIANVGFGQALNATPVALVSAFGMLANGGLRMRPSIVQSIDGKQVPMIAEKQVVRPETADKVLKLMESVIQTDAGTGKSLRIAGYRLAGKTGTAQKIRSKKSKLQGGHVSSFVGVVPANDPRAVILVMIDQPRAGKIYGSQVAGPVFLQLAKTVIKHFQIPPTPAIVKEDPK